jgi:hypothetical protein
VVLPEQLGNFLSENKLIVTNRPKDAEFLLRFRGNTTKGASFQGIHTANLTVGYELIDLSTGTQVKNVTLNRINGVGVSSGDASLNAYENAGKELKPRIRHDLMPLLR